MRGWGVQVMSSSLDATRLDRRGSSRVNIDDGLASCPTALSVWYIDSLYVIAQNSRVCQSVRLCPHRLCLDNKFQTKWHFEQDIWHADSSRRYIGQVHNNNSNNIIIMAMFMVLSSWSEPLREFTRFIWWVQTQRQAATNPQTKPTDLGCETPVGCYHPHHHRHLSKPAKQVWYWALRVYWQPHWPDSVCMYVCMYVPNFVKIGPTAAEIWQFLDFSKWRPPPSWIFEISNF